MEAGEHRPHETLVVDVLHVDDRLPPGELRRGREVGRPVQGLYAAMWMVMSTTASSVHPDPSAM